MEKFMIQLRKITEENFIDAFNDYLPFFAGKLLTDSVKTCILFFVWENTVPTEFPCKYSWAERKGNCPGAELPGKAGWQLVLPY